MNAAHVHLLLCHVPTLGVLFASVLLVAATLRRDRNLHRAALVGLVVASLAAVPTYLSGDGARAVVESAPGMADELIDVHRDDAWRSLLPTIALGVGAVVALFLSRGGRELDGWLQMIMLLLAVAALAALVWTSSRGGTIRHREIAGHTAQLVSS